MEITAEQFEKAIRIAYDAGRNVLPPPWSHCEGHFRETLMKAYNALPARVLCERFEREKCGLKWLGSADYYE